MIDPAGFQETELHKLHLRLAAIESGPIPQHLQPASEVYQHSGVRAPENFGCDGSGTGRYPEGDNWTQHSDGLDYPGSYGVGNETLVAGSDIRVLNLDGSVDPVIYKATTVTSERVTFERDGHEAIVPRSSVVKVKPEANKPAASKKAWTPDPPKR
jgi:hypothetical protein